MTKCTSKSFNCYWWNDQPNFGDALAPFLLNRLTGKEIKWAKPQSAEIYAVGSILEHIPDIITTRTPPLKICGAGCMSPKKLNYQKAKHLDVRLTRGPLSAICCLQPETPTGDPGLTISKFIPNTSWEKRNAIGLVTHHHTKLSATYRSQLEDAGWKIINTATNDIVGIAKQIQACKVIFSESLHGLITADSYNIPNVWLKNSKIHRDAYFKFYDYFLSINRNPSHALTNLTRSAVREALKYPSSITRHFSYVAEKSDEICQIFDMV
jgi:hypothetical protein